ncbi:MAG: hypothetical protein SGPRY_000188 [Prymnesium sp.]
MLEPLVLRMSTPHVSHALMLFERKGFRLVGLKASDGMAHLALSAPAALASAAPLCAHLSQTLPASANFHASSTIEESLERMHATFSAREIVQWEPYEEAEVDGEVSLLSMPLLGAHNSFREHFWLHELLSPDTVGSETSKRFCSQLRRDSFVPLLLPKEDADLYKCVEEAASSWFAMSEDEKLESGGAYGHIDRKFTGYRCGKFREQLEVCSRVVQLTTRLSGNFATIHSFRYAPPRRRDFTLGRKGHRKWARCFTN